MLRKFLFASLLCACVSGNAMAQISALDLEVSAAFSSKYIWNGFDRIRGQGLDEGPVLQPRVSLSMGNTPLHFAVGGSFVVNDASEFHETTYHAYVQRYASPFTRVSMGYTYYDDRVSPLLGAADRDQHEIWGNLESRNMAGVRTGVSLKYEMSARDAYDSYLFAIAELGYSVPLVAGTPGTLGLDMNSAARILYNTDINVQGVEVVRSGISAWQLGLAAELRAASVKVTPFVEYQVSLEDAVNDEDPLWGGISVAYAF